ncbi:membrane or secreted protein [Flavobacteriaceae bacterium]|nr:membrane or secreted protein [Flavobacteriaceae bacterium]
MEIFLISIVLVTVAFSGIAIKLIFKKNGEFSGTCASQSPFLQNSDEPCGICGKIQTSSECANDSK